MANAMKCDVCGKFYIPLTKKTTIHHITLRRDNNPNDLFYDVCNDCSEFICSCLKNNENQYPYDPVSKAYQILVKAMEEQNSTGLETNLSIAVQEAIGYLGEALDE